MPVLLALYYIPALTQRLRLWLLVLASFAFYAFWDWRLLPFLILSIVGNWILGWLYVRMGRRGPVLPFAIALNLGILGIFKYTGFAAELLNLQIPAWSIILPLGISFFTFEQISWLVELKRNNAPVYSIDRYAFYVALFTRLIAGPIVRHYEILPQLEANPYRSGLAQRLAEGSWLLLLGLLKKLLLADNLALLVDPIFNGGMHSAGLVGVAALGFALQIYFDFSGYTDMAHGLARMLGFSLPQNFNSPYRAVSVQDFWRRWHMSLSRFLRDYLYIPLGGSRAGEARRYFALMATMTLGGLWHGAGLNFILWGFLHGLALVVHNIWQKFNRPLPHFIAQVLTFAFVVALWLPFRITDYTGLQVAIEALSKPAAVVLPITSWALLVIGLLLVWFTPRTDQIIEKPFMYTRPMAIVAGLLYVLVLILVGEGGNAKFIYFQF